MSCLPFFGTGACRGLVGDADSALTGRWTARRECGPPICAGSLFPAASSNDCEASARTHGWGRPPQQNKPTDRLAARWPASGARWVSDAPRPPGCRLSLGWSLLPALLVSMIKYLMTFPLKQQETAESDSGSIFPIELIIICCLQNWSEQLRARGKRGGRWIFPQRVAGLGEMPLCPVSPAGCLSVVAVFHAQCEKLDGGLGTGPRGWPPCRRASSPVRSHASCLT